MTNAIPPNVFLLQFPEFTPNQNAKVLTEYKRLAQKFSWTTGSVLYKANKEQYLLGEWDRYMGNNTTRLATHQDICRQLGIAVPTSINQCKIALKSQVHVNMIDVLDGLRGNGDAKRFGSAAQLRDYTKKTNRYFPLGGAKQRNELSTLLRFIGGH